MTSSIGVKPHPLTAATGGTILASSRACVPQAYGVLRFQRRAGLLDQRIGRHFHSGRIIARQMTRFQVEHDDGESECTRPITRIERLAGAFFGELQNSFSICAGGIGITATKRLEFRFKKTETRRFCGVVRRINPRLQAFVSLADDGATRLLPEIGQEFAGFRDDVADVDVCREPVGSSQGCENAAAAAQQHWIRKIHLPPAPRVVNTKGGKCGSDTAADRDSVEIAVGRLCQPERAFRPKQAGESDAESIRSRHLSIDI